MRTPTGPDVDTDGWTVLVPVKPLGLAKSRLASALDPRARRELVLAMAADVLSVCTASSHVSTVRALSSDPAVLDLAHRLGVDAAADPGGEPADPGGESAGSHADPLNRAVASALTGVTGPVGVVTADLPELRPAHLDRILAEAARHRHSFVPDHLDVGTTMAFWTFGAPDRVPRFGTGSAERYAAVGGAVPLVGSDPTGASRRDVDTADDLAALSGRRVSDATARVLRRLTGTVPAPGDGLSVTMVP